MKSMYIYNYESIMPKKSIKKFWGLVQYENLRER